MMVRYLSLIQKLAYKLDMVSYCQGFCISYILLNIDRNHTFYEYKNSYKCTYIQQSLYMNYVLEAFYFCKRVVLMKVVKIKCSWKLVVADQ